MKKLLIAAACCGAAAVSAVPAMAAGPALSAAGTSTGTSQEVTNDPSATCNPQQPTSTSDLYCEFTNTGSWTASDKHALAKSMTYTGTTLVDYTTYGTVAGHEGQGCAYVTGNAEFVDKHDVLQTVYDADSYICETNTANQDSTHLVLDVVGGTGKFHDASGAITSDGTSTLSNTPGTWNDSATTTGSVSR